MATIMYHSLDAALTAARISVDVLDFGDTWRVRVTAPWYLNKRYMLPQIWSKEFDKDRVRREAKALVMDRYDIRRVSGYAIGD